MTDAPKRTRCTCEWAHPVDGTIDVNWPAELDPHCEIHGEPMGFPESLVAALEAERDDWKCIYGERVDERNKLDRRVAELEAALKKYGWHEDGCLRGDYGYKRLCTCGWMEVRALTEEE